MPGTTVPCVYGCGRRGRSFASCSPRIGRPPAVGKACDRALPDFRLTFLARPVGVVSRIHLIEVAEAVENPVPARPLPHQLTGSGGISEPLRARAGSRESVREIKLGLLAGE